MLSRAPSCCRTHLICSPAFVVQVTATEGCRFIAQEEHTLFGIARLGASHRNATQSLDRIVDQKLRCNVSRDVKQPRLSTKKQACCPKLINRTQKLLIAAQKGIIGCQRDASAEVNLDRSEETSRPRAAQDRMQLLIAAHKREFACQREASAEVNVD